MSQGLVQKAVWQGVSMHDVCGAPAASDLQQGWVSPEGKDRNVAFKSSLDVLRELFLA